MPEISHGKQYCGVVLDGTDIGRDLKGYVEFYVRAGRYRLAELGMHP